jgi:TonB-dependent SusC/RagA subfamily outer membrane receptor
MKKFVPAILIFLLTAATATAQPIRMDARGRAIPQDQQPLIIVDSVVTDFDHLLITADQILSIDVLKDSAAVAVYGDKAKHGLIIVHTKEKGAILSLAGLLDEFHIPEADRNLRVCIDNILVKDNNRILADKTNVVNVVVITGICWISPIEPGPEERYINIITKKAAKPVQ